MATKNFFDLLGDDENEDPSQVVLRAVSISAVAKPAAGVVKKPVAAPQVLTKPASPAEAGTDGQRGPYDGVRGGRGGARGGRGGRGNYYGERDGMPREGVCHPERNFDNERSVGQTRDADGFVGARSLFVEKPFRLENGEGRSFEGGRGGGRGRGRGGRGFGEGEQRLRRREFDRRSGNARGNEIEKRAGAGRCNWGTEVDATLIQETVFPVQGEETPGAEPHTEIKPELETSADTTVVEGAAELVNEEEEAENEMTLEEYEKVLEEKRKALESEKASERKVQVDKAFENMQLVDSKKREEDIFIKLGQDKERVKKEAAEREEKSRKPVSINEFLKPAEGVMYYVPPPNRGRGGRGSRGDRREGGGGGDRDSSHGSVGSGRFAGSCSSAGGASVPKIEDQTQFPTLGGK